MNKRNKTIFLYGTYLIFTIIVVYALSPISQPAREKIIGSYTNWKNERHEKKIDMVKEKIVQQEGRRLPELTVKDISCLEEITYGDYTYMLFRVTGENDSVIYAMATAYGPKGVSISLFDKAKVVYDSRIRVEDAFVQLGYVLDYDDVKEVYVYSSTGAEAREPSYTINVSEHLYDDGKVFYCLIPFTKSMMENGFLHFDRSYIKRR